MYEFESYSWDDKRDESASMHDRDQGSGIKVSIGPDLLRLAHPHQGLR